MSRGRVRSLSGVRRLALLPLLAAAVISCAPPAPLGAGAPSYVYAASGNGTALQRFDATSGRALADVAPAAVEGPLADILPGGEQQLVVLGLSSARRAGEATVLGTGPEWSSRPVTLEPGADVSLMATDGSRYAALAYGIRQDGVAGSPLPCRVGVVDLTTGQEVRRLTRCEQQGRVLGLALATVDGDPMAYLSMPEIPSPGHIADAPATGEVVAMNATTGDEAASVRLNAFPVSLFFGGPAGGGRRLYVIASLGNPSVLLDGDAPMERVVGARGWLLVELEPRSLVVERIHLLPERPFRIAVSQDGEDAYALGAPSLVQPGRLWHLDLLTGGVELLREVPAGAIALAIAGDRIYVGDTFGDAVWIVDRQRGTLLHALPGVRRPLALAAE